MPMFYHINVDLFHIKQRELCEATLQHSKTCYKGWVLYWSENVDCDITKKITTRRHLKFSYLHTYHFSIPPLLDPKMFDIQRIFLKRSKRVWLPKLDRWLELMWMLKKIPTSFANFIIKVVFLWRWRFLSRH